MAAAPLRGGRLPATLHSWKEAPSPALPLKCCGFSPLLLPPGLCTATSPPWSTLQCGVAGGAGRAHGTNELGQLQRGHGWMRTLLRDPSASHLRTRRTSSTSPPLPLQRFRVAASLSYLGYPKLQPPGCGFLEPQEPQSLSSGQSSPRHHHTCAALGSRNRTEASHVVSAHKAQDMYADLARYGIMDDFDMAPLPYYAASSAVAPPPPPGSPASLPKAPPGRPRRKVAEPEQGGPESTSSSDDVEGFQGELARSSAHMKARGLGEGTGVKAGGKGAQLLDEAGPGTWCVYLLLACDEKKTYVGVTNDVERRLKQHNGDVVGGAKTTKAGRPWSLICSVSGFQTRSEAFQFEWRWKNPMAVKGDGSFDRNSMAPSAQLLRESEAAAEAGSAQMAPLVVERRRAALEEALRTFPKWRYLHVNWVASMRR